MQVINEGRYTFGEYELDAARRSLTRNGEPISLYPKAFDVLHELVENHGCVLTKEEILNRVWPGQFVEENNLSVQISALRKVFGERNGKSKFIVTVPGKGYKFVAELNQPNGEIVIENHKIERISFEESEPEVKHLRPEQNSSRRLLIFAFSALVVIGAGFWLWSNNRTAAAPIESIAVMPFIYEGGNSDTEYLSDGMTESLINNLSQIPNLTVKARSSVFYYKGKEIAPLQVGDELNVQAVLLGRIAERGENLNISLELVDAKTNNHLWGEQYTRKKLDLAVLQNEIARDISAKLLRKLGNNETMQKGQTANTEAYKLYLKGRFLWNKRKHDEHVKALAAFEQAIALDPSFALAYAGIGDVYTVDSFRGTNEENNPKGRAAAQKALEIEPNLAEALTVLAKIEWNEFRRDEAEKNFKRALAINPNYASARQWHAESLVQQGRFEESTAEIKRALELDPLSSTINSDAIYIYIYARQYDRAIAQANKLLELDASWFRAYSWRGSAYESKGDYAGALTDFEKSSELSDRPGENKAKDRENFSQIRQAFEKSGEKGYWRKSLEVVRSFAPEESDYYFEAICHAKLGDKENALASLEKALERKAELINLMKVEPYFDSLQSEPRFQTLLRRIGLTR